MKLLFAILALVATQSAQAATPQLYCVSTKSFDVINQINIFTNKSGTARVSLQFWAADEQNIGSFDTNTIHTVRSLKYDEATGVFSNRVNKLKLEVEKESITPAEAERLMSAREGYNDLLNPQGHKVEFSKYYKAKVTAYNLTGKKDSWAQELQKAFKAGVTDYVCGNIVDAQGRKKGPFDDLLEDGE